MDLYLFDFDKTLYAYDFHFPLPALSLVTGLSQSHLAEIWWAGGCELRAESGEWPRSDQSLEDASPLGIHTHQLRYVNGVPQTDAMDAAISRFEDRNA